MIVTGRNPVIEAVRSGQASQVFIRKGTNFYDVTIPVRVEIMGKSEFEKRFGMETQGVAAVVPDIEPADFNLAVKTLHGKNTVILDRIQDPHNFGAIVRAAHCFGVRDVIIPRYQQASITPAVYRASAGSLFYMNIIEAVNLGAAVDALKKIGHTIIAAEAEGETPLPELNVPGAVGIIIGSEGRGVRESLTERADVRVRIPMQADIDSLNASQSASIMLYEVFTRASRG